MATRRSLRGVPEDLPDAENAPAPAGNNKHTLQRKMGRPRAAFTELTNAIEKGLTGGKKTITKLGVKKVRPGSTAGVENVPARAGNVPVSAARAGNVPVSAARADNVPVPVVRIKRLQQPTVAEANSRPALTAIKPRAGVKRSAANTDATDIPAPSKKARKLRAVPTVSDLTVVSSSSSSLTTSSTHTDTDCCISVSISSTALAGPAESLTSVSSASFQTPPEPQSPDADAESEAEKRHAEVVARLNAENAAQRPCLPDGVIDFDSESKHDLFGVPDYVNDVFDYYRQRESSVQVSRYLGTTQPDLTDMMRAILVDWMVEVQESFELNHETLYLAVRLVDLYLGQVEVNRETLQLVGATAIFIACKFDERLPPPLDDFLYICEDAYARREVIQTEMRMLTTVNYDLGLPLSYRFLRRYARCCKLTTEVLTLARFVLETSLMEYSLITEAGSRLAAAALTLAVLMRLGADQFQQLKPTIQHFSGYKTEELSDLVTSLNDMLRKEPNSHLKTIRAKYSHSVFHQVAKIPTLDQLPAL